MFLHLPLVLLVGLDLHGLLIADVKLVIPESVYLLLSSLGSVTLGVLIHSGDGEGVIDGIIFQPDVVHGSHKLFIFVASGTISEPLVHPLITVGDRLSSAVKRLRIVRYRRVNCVIFEGRFVPEGFSCVGDVEFSLDGKISDHFSAMQDGPFLLSI